MLNPPGHKDEGSYRGREKGRHLWPYGSLSRRLAEGTTPYIPLEPEECYIQPYSRNNTMLEKKLKRQTRRSGILSPEQSRHAQKIATYCLLLAARDGQEAVQARNIDARPEAIRQGGGGRSCGRAHGTEHKKSAASCVHPHRVKKGKRAWFFPDPVSGVSSEIKGLDLKAGVAPATAT